MLVKPCHPAHQDLGDQINLHTNDWGVSYTTIGTIVVGCKGQGLHILECCAAGGAGIDVPQEFLAASCTRSSGRRNRLLLSQGRFLSALIQNMKEMLPEYSHFSVAELHARMVTEGNQPETRLTTQPWYRKATKSPRSS